MFSIFPRLANTTFKVTSPPTSSYNCIAWAAGDANKFWWPDAMETAYWPEGIERSDTVEAFVKAYGTLGYTPCDSDELEIGFEKIAIYAKDDAVKHAARQLENGHWTSKLGKAEDIEHVLEGLVSTTYGEPVKFLKRKR